MSEKVKTYEKSFVTSCDNPLRILDRSHNVLHIQHIAGGLVQAFQNKLVTSPFFSLHHKLIAIISSICSNTVVVFEIDNPVPILSHLLLK